MTEMYQQRKNIIEACDACLRSYTQRICIGIYSVWYTYLKISIFDSDSGCSLVSSKNFSEILPPNGWRPRPGKVGQGGLKVLHLWCHSQKTRTPQAKKFFFRVQTRRLAASFDIFTGSVEHTGPEKFPCKATCI